MYETLEIGAVDPTIGIAPAIAGEYVRLSRIPALSKAQALIGTADSVAFLTPVLTEKAKLQCSRMLGVLARC